MQIYYTERASKDLEDLPILIQKRIASKMRFYAHQKNPLGFAKHLINPAEGGFRFRVGDYRIFFDVIKNHIYVLRIKHRGKAYD